MPLAIAPMPVAIVRAVAPPPSLITPLNCTPFAAFVLAQLLIVRVVAPERLLTPLTMVRSLFESFFQLWLPLRERITAWLAVAEPIVTAPGVLCPPMIRMPLVPSVSVWLAPPPSSSVVPVFENKRPWAACAAFRLTTCPVSKTARSPEPGTNEGLQFARLSHPDVVELPQ